MGDRKLCSDVQISSDILNESNTQEKLSVASNI